MNYSHSEHALMSVLVILILFAFELQKLAPIWIHILIMKIRVQQYRHKQLNRLRWWISWHIWSVWNHFAMKNMCAVCCAFDKTHCACEHTYFEFKVLFANNSKWAPVSSRERLWFVEYLISLMNSKTTKNGFSDRESERARV